MSQLPLLCRCVSGDDSPDAVARLRQSLPAADDGGTWSALMETADKAGLAPGLQIAGVDGKVWSPEQLDDAIERSVASGRIELLVISGDTYVTRVLEYDGGPRHLVLVRDEDREDRIAEIMAPRPGPDAAQ